MEPESQLVIALVGYQERSGKSFSEFRTGPDYLEFLVDRREDLNDWAERLTGLGLPHSRVKEPGYTGTPSSPFATPTTSSSSSSGGHQPNKSPTEPVNCGTTYNFALPKWASWREAARASFATAPLPITDYPSLIRSHCHFDGLRRTARQCVTRRISG